MIDDIFDTHAHYDDEQFDVDRDEVLRSMPENGVRTIMNCAVDVPTALKSIQLAEKYDFIYAAVGLHPEELNHIPETDTFEIAELIAKNKKVKALGEIGLDYHWKEVSREKQLYFFEQQVIIANGLQVPVIVHDREAHEDTLEILKKYKPCGVVHCFSGSAETARELLEIGMYIGIGGAVTFKNAKKIIKVAEILPTDRLLLETDCPYMSPAPFRGKRNDSSRISFVAQKIAEIKGESAQSIVDAAAQNGKKLFNID